MWDSLAGKSLDGGSREAILSLNMSMSNEKHLRELKTIRDTVESIAIAIIMAFVLRAFLVEGFVIPTGSMAQQLMGEHFQLTCRACHWKYPYGFSGNAPDRKKLYEISGAECPNCGLSRSETDPAEHVRGGDRVLVMKYSYRFCEPQPWDVIVFTNPQSNENNYIKRLIGIPGETLEIVHGDIFVTPYKGTVSDIRRKPPHAQNAMWQIVHDNDFILTNEKMLSDDGYDKPRRWAPEGLDSCWNLNIEKGRVFEFKGGNSPGLLTFEGLRKQVKNKPWESKSDLNDQLRQANSDSMTEAFVPRYGYDSRHQEENHLDPDRPSQAPISVDLCGDLKLSAVFTPKTANPGISLILFNMQYGFRVDIATSGKILLYRRPRDSDSKPWKDYLWAKADGSELTMNRGWNVSLEHVDCSVRVMVDGASVIYKEYHANKELIKNRMAQARNGGNPLPAPKAQLGTMGGKCLISHIKLQRDVYYTESVLGRPRGNASPHLMDHAEKVRQEFSAKGNNRKVEEQNSPGWGTNGYPITLHKHEDNPDLDEFFVLGDNSPQSLDSRGWIEAAPSLKLLDKDGKVQYQLGTVPRYNLIGKAMFVYWPAGHSLPLLPGLPILPDIGSMRLIR